MQKHLERDEFILLHFLFNGGWKENSQYVLVQYFFYFAVSLVSEDPWIFAYLSLGKNSLWKSSSTVEVGLVETAMLDDFI